MGMSIFDLLTIIRNKVVAVDNSEHEENICCIVAPIRDLFMMTDIILY
jgi:DNA-binding IclR family transcriptional regulator